MYCGSKFVYLGNEAEDEEEVDVVEGDDIVLSASDSSDDDDGEVCVLDILDTAGQEEYSSMRDQYVRDGDGFVIIYSVSDTASFQEAEAIYNWLLRVKDEKPVAILVANKQDLTSDEVVVPNDQGQGLAAKLGLNFFQTSALTGQGVKDAFEGLVRETPRISKDYKVVMLGSGAVGKSSICLRFVNDTFVDDYDPTIEDSYRKMIRVTGLKSLDKTERKARRKNKKMKRKGASSGWGGGMMGPSSGFRLMGNIAPGSSNAMQRRRSARNRPKSGGAGLLGSLKAAFGFGPSSSQQMQQQQQQQMPQQLQQQQMLQQLHQGPPAPPLPHSISSFNDDAPIVKKKIKTKKTDGNVMLIPLRDLANEPNLVTGDAITCSGCQAVLTSTASLTKEGEKSSWTCEFCGHVTTGLDISEDEIPKGESIDFMLSPPTKPVSAGAEEGAEQAEKKKETTPGTIVYCMDISSSMAANCELPQSQVAWREARGGGSTSNRITRLQCIQTAVGRLAEQLKTEEPEKKVLLAVFGSEIYIKAGGGPCHPRNHRYQDLEHKTMKEMLDKGLTLANEYPLLPIEQSHDPLQDEVQRLSTTGCTALGPALALSVGFVSKIPSSEVVLCTDGEPNVGIGSRNDAAFYNQIGTYAREKNVTINILAMEGASVGLSVVSQAAELSGGTTNKLNPAELVRQLRTIAQNEVVANSVTVTFFLHPNFVFDEPGFPENLSRLEKEVGSVRKETDLSFRFKLKDPTHSGHTGPVPFQVQINYTRQSDGMKCMRVLSKSTEATSDRKTMEENINVAVMGVAAMKTSAMLAKEGQGMQAQQQLKNVKRLVKRGAKSSEQQEERLAFQAQAQAWDDELTDRNDIYRDRVQDDMGSKMVNLACASNMMQQSAIPTKMRQVKSRKMKSATKAAYYSYRDGQ